MGVLSVQSSAVQGIQRGLDGLRRDAERARALGFDGKSLIHPGQIEVINRVLVPAMRHVGELFGRGEMLLPFVLQSGGGSSATAPTSQLFGIP